MTTTPIQSFGSIFLKRDDLFSYAGISGGKVRSALSICQNATRGIVTAGSRHSPQIEIVSVIAREMGLPLRAHTASGELTDELIYAQNNGAEIIQHKPGYNVVIIKRAIDDAEKMGYLYVPFGMECEEAIIQTSSQVLDIPTEVSRIIMPIGSGMSFLGVAQGLKKIGSSIPLIGIQVGADPTKRFKKYNLTYSNLEIIKSEYKYEKRLTESVGDVELDPIYESKCKKYLKEGDLLWIVGKRA